MAAETFVFNIAKGRGVEFQNRVDSNDPAASAFILVPLSVGGSQAQGQDFDDLAAVLGDANFDELTTGGWSRKTLTDADLAAIAVDDTNNRFPVVLPAVSWGSPTAGTVVQFLLCYDGDTGAGTDSNIIPMSAHAVTVVADGSAVTQNAGDAIRAS